MIESQELDNIIRWREGQRGFHEAYVFKLVHPKTREAIALRYSVLAPKNGDPRVALSALYFDKRTSERTLALRRDYPLSAFKAERDIFYVQIDNASFYNNGLRGTLAQRGEEVSWDLSFVPNNSTFIHLPNRLYYHLPLPKTKILAPNLSVAVDGEFKIKRAGATQTLAFHKTPGSQAHLWGSTHITRWVWASCNAFKEDKTAVFEALSAQQPLVFTKRQLPHLSTFYIKSAAATVSARGVSDWVMSRSTYSLNRWDFEFSQGALKCIGTVSCQPAWMIGVTYPDPGGDKRYAAVTQVADIELSLYRRDKGHWSVMQTLTAKDSVAYEVAGPVNPMER